MPKNKRFLLTSNPGFTFRRTLLRKNLVNAQQGFTFIELLVVIVTMALLFTVGFANYRGFQDRQRLIAAARDFKADLRFAQEQALANVKPPSPPNPVCGTINGYRLTLTSNSYTIDANCDINNYILVKTINFSQKYPTMTFSPNSTIYFNSLGRGVRASVAITLSDSKTGTSTSISVTQGGEIN